MCFHKSQIFFYLLSAFILGVFVGSFSLIGIEVILILVIFGVSIIILSYKNKFGLLAGFLILFFAFGGWRLHSVNNSAGDLEELIGKEARVIGYIDGEPEIDKNLQRLVLKAGDSRILVTVNSYPEYEYGDFIEAVGELESPINFTDFDYITYLKKDGIKVTIFFPEIKIYSGEVDLDFGDSIRRRLYGGIFKLKNKFQTAVNSSVAEPKASFINGILLGSRQNIQDELKESFNKTGTTHILAISGYNIMIISWAVLAGLIWFFKRRTAFWISVGVIISFVILTGASSSVVRAAVMGLLLSFAQGYGRMYDQKNSIILAGGVMIYHNPLILVFDIGFQLSFAAVLGLIYLYPYIDYKLYKVSKFGIVKELILMTFSAQLAVLPLALYYFGSFSIFSLPANVLILPFLPAAMLFGFLSGLAGIFFLPLGQLIGHIAWAVIAYQIWVIEFFARLT